MIVENKTNPIDTNLSTKKIGFRKQGKIDTKKYYEIKMRKLDDWKTLFESIVLAIIVMLPFILILIQLFYTYAYHSTIRFILILVGWLIIMIMNGLSNYFQISIAKAVFTDSALAQELNPKAVFVYQTTNIGFAVFIGVLIFLYYCYIIYAG